MQQSRFSTIEQNLERWLCLMFYSMIVLTIISEVTRRFVLSYSSIWGEEVARYCFIYLAWIGASLAVKNRAHIRIDVLLGFLPNRAQIAMYLFSDFLTLGLAVISLIVSIGPVITSLEYGSVTHGLRISQVWFLFAVPFGFTLIVLRVLQSIRRDVKALLNNGQVYQGERLID
ncbi:TRAP transporter small permease [Vibrio sp. S9_S30]|uniref:TRAP transporter small permease n=1 Tax=Vibrio sp. S9_S30 TaxID=2720226 RepID=UPI00168198B9|nr:TRAP transporter small permease [Vibrio sp. S9_S30]MBD1558811.1 TRAP transporter small permease [Vibrio sp. S9_S30]